MNKSELLAIEKPILGLVVDNVEDTIVELDPNKVSEKTKTIFFLFSDFYISFYNNHYQIKMILKFFRDRVSLIFIVVHSNDHLLMLISKFLPLHSNCDRPFITLKKLF